MGSTDKTQKQDWVKRPIQTHAMFKMTKLFKLHSNRQLCSKFKDLPFEHAFGSDFCGKLIKVKYYLNKSILLKKFSTLSHHAFHWWPVK